jgi:hypothetical protein
MASLKELDAIVNGMNLKEVPLHHVCEACIEGKHQRTSFPKDEAIGEDHISWWSTILCHLHQQLFKKNSCLPLKSERRGV